MDRISDKQWDGKSRGGGFGYNFFVYTIRFLGIRCAYCLLAFIVVYFIPFAPKATRSIWQYNRKRRGLGIFGSVRELYCHYYLFGQTLIDKIAMRGGMADRYRYIFDNYDRFIEILNGGTGIVMIGAHIGCWEASAGFFGEYGKRINIVMFDNEHRRIKEVLNKNAEYKNDYKIIAVNRDTIEAMVQIKIALNNGEYICFNGDRYLHKTSALKVPFKGSPAYFPTSPFRIASKCRVPVVFYYAMREQGRTYRFIFEEAHCDERTDTEALLLQYTKSLENIIGKYPRQWFNFYDFWND